MILFEDEYLRVAAHQGRVTIRDKLNGMDRIATEEEADHYWDEWTRVSHGTATPPAPATRDDDRS